MNWKIGKEYKTKEGGKAVILDIVENQVYCLIGKVWDIDEKEWFPESWDSQGKRPSYSVDYNIIKEPEEVTVYVYDNDGTLIFHLKKYENNCYLGKTKINLNDLEK